MKGCGISNCGGAQGSKNAAKAQQTKNKATGVQGYHKRRCAKKRNDKHVNEIKKESGACGSGGVWRPKERGAWSKRG